MSVIPLTDTALDSTALTSTALTSTALTNTAPVLAPAALAPVACDLYRDIHKGIRSQLFGLVTAAGSIDPGSVEDRRAVSADVLAVADLLEGHAHHEDAAILATLQAELPDLAERIEIDHDLLERRFGWCVEQAIEFPEATHDRRHRAQQLHLDLALFITHYLGHMDLEERVVMPQLEVAIGVEAVVAMNAAIVGSIPPEEMMQSLAFMLPAMNLEDRCELLTGMRAGAPPEAFAAVVDLARSVLVPSDLRALRERLDLV